MARENILKRSRVKKDTKLLDAEKQRQDLGFGTKVTDDNTRLINKDGTYNVRKIGQSFIAWLNPYHRLITMPLTKLVFLIICTYLGINVIFAGIYTLIGIEHLAGIEPKGAISPFWETFFFSAQTLTTVGYGRVSPLGFAANIVASLEALLGLVIFALITGIVYGRFSRPEPKIRFSKNILIAPYLDMNALMFRMVNERSNQIINIKVSLVLSRNELINEKITRKYYTLDLERNAVLFFPTNWTLVHPITENSPLAGKTQQDIIDDDSEFLIAIEGIDDTFADPIHLRFSYSNYEMVWGAKFNSMLDVERGDAYIVDINKIDEFDNVSLNE